MQSIRDYSLAKISPMDTPIKILPTIPLVEPFNIGKRIEELRNYLDPKHSSYQPERQHNNIRAAIKLYERGQIDGTEQVFIKDGKIVTKKEIFEGPPCSWIEGMFHQFAQKHAYGPGALNTSFQT
jgi:hypothetical protein